MTTKERIQAELERLTEADMDDLLRVIQSRTEAGAGTSASPPPNPVAEEEAERFARWADNRPPRSAPVIPLEALDREHIYGDFD